MTWAPEVKTLVITPALNEERSIFDVVQAVKREGYDIVVIDDGSTDQTATRAADAGAFVLKMPFNTGVGGALRCGMLFALQHGFDAVVQVDADGQHPAHCINILEAACRDNGAHMVIGSRFAEGSNSKMEVSTTRRLAMRALARSASSATGSTITDATSGFRLIRTPLLNELAHQLPAHYLGDTFEAIVSSGRAGYRIIEIPVPLAEREFGTSTASPMQAAKWTLRAALTSAFRLHERLKQAPHDDHQASVTAR